MTVPADLQYTADHEWLRLQGETATIGITAFAADALGDIVYLELPDPGASITEGAVCGEVESTKSVSDLLAPVDAEVLEVNALAVAEPHLVNSDPYGEGWMLKVRVTTTPVLLDAGQYEALVEAS